MSLGIMIKTDKPIVVFDTECVLCCCAVPFILSRERMSSLRFVAAWSEEGIALAAQHGFSHDDLARTFFVITGMRVLTRSDAALEIAKHLRKLWSFLSLLRALPQRINDAGYDLVDRHRLQLFGRRKSCMGNPPFLVGFWRRRVEEIFYLEKHETQLFRMLKAVRLRLGRAYPDQCQCLVSKQAAPALALWGPAGR